MNDDNNKKDEDINNYNSEIQPGNSEQQGYLERQEHSKRQEHSQQLEHSEQPLDEWTPWKQAMHRIITGIIMGSITLNFLKLNYILPTIGMFLILLGFRTVREKNKWFRYGYVLSIIRLTFHCVNLMMYSTIFTSMEKVSDVLYKLNMSSILPYILFLYCLYQGIQVIQEENGVEKTAGVIVAFILWNVVIWLLAIIQVQVANIIVLGILLIWYIVIIYKLSKLLKSLDETHIVLDVKVSSVSDRVFTIVFTSTLLICLLCGNLFFSSYPMEWKEVVKVDESEELKEPKQHLMELGFPEDILKDLSEEDILACAGATRLVMESNEYYANSQYNTVFDDNKEIRITGIGVELDGEREEWRLIHHFKWIEPTSFYGTEAIQLWQVFSHNKEFWDKNDDATGQVLYNKNGKVYSSSYYSLGEESYKSGGFFLQSSDKTDLFATFSFPKKGTEQRGYISYGIVEMMDGSIIDSWVNYVHQKSWLQYPTVTAKEHRKKNGFTSSIFSTIQDALQFYPNEK